MHTLHTIYSNTWTRVPFPSLHSQRGDWGWTKENALTWAPAAKNAQSLLQNKTMPSNNQGRVSHQHTNTSKTKFSAQLTILSSRCCWRLQNTFRQGPAGQLLGRCQTHGAPLPQISKDRVPKYTSIHETFQCYKVMQAVTLKSNFGIYKQCLTPFLSGGKTCLWLPK